MSSTSVIDLQVQRNREIEERARLALQAQAEQAIERLRVAVQEVRRFNAEHQQVVGTVAINEAFNQDAARHCATRDQARSYLEDVEREIGKLREAMDSKRTLSVKKVFEQLAQGVTVRTAQDVVKVVRTSGRVVEQAAAAGLDAQKLAAGAEKLVRMHCKTDSELNALLPVVHALRDPVADTHMLLAQLKHAIHDQQSRESRAVAARERLMSMRAALAGLPGTDVSDSLRQIESAMAAGACGTELEMSVADVTQAARQRADRAYVASIVAKTLRERGFTIDDGAFTRVMVAGGSLQFSKPDDAEWSDKHHVDVTVNAKTGAIRADVTRSDGDFTNLMSDAVVRERFMRVEANWCDSLAAVRADARAAGVIASIQPESFVESKLRLSTVAAVHKHDATQRGTASRAQPFDDRSGKT